MGGSSKNGTQKGPAETRKVDFVVAGTQKGGTSALDSYLRLHPEICMALTKEVHFFDDETHFQGNEVDYTRYHAFFAAESSHRVLGETTPIYMYWYDAPCRIWCYKPDMKIIMLLRNPIDRAYSAWNMERDRGSDTRSFWDAIEGEQEVCREALPDQHRLFSYVDRGFYTEQLRRIWHFFPRTQTMVLKSEELRLQPHETLARIFSFLGVGSIQSAAPMVVHARPYLIPMGGAERNYLVRVFLHEIRELECLLGWDCSQWVDG